MRGAQFSTIVVSGLFSLAIAASANAAPVTVTGCLEKGQKGEFQLSHATGGSAEQYELIGAKGVDLSAHVGHKVEVTGETASEKAEKHHKKEGMEAHHEHIEVSALKHIATSCP
jgi:hypothetical protein